MSLYTCDVHRLHNAGKIVGQRSDLFSEVAICPVSVDRNEHSCASILEHWTIIGVRSLSVRRKKLKILTDIFIFTCSLSYL